MSSQAQQARQLAREGVEAGRAGNHAEARQKLAQATQLDPQLTEAWFYLGLFLEDPQQQMQAFQRVLFLKPDHQRAQEALNALQQQHGAAPLAQQPPAQQAPPQPQPAPQQFSDPFAAAGSPQPQPAQQAPPQQPSQAGQAFQQAGQAFGAAASDLGQQMRSQLGGEQGRNLFRAWLAALRFDSNNSYEKYRGRKNVLVTAALIFVVAVVALSIGSLWFELTNSFGFDFGRLLRGVLSAVLTAAELVLALYVASWVGSYIGRIRFESSVDTAEHFSLSGLYWVPVLLLAVVVIALMQVAAQLFSSTAAVDEYITAAGYTALMLTGYFIGQFVYSNAAIHRVRAFPAVVISLVAGAIACLVFLWLQVIVGLIAP